MAGTVLNDTDSTRNASGSLRIAAATAAPPGPTLSVPSISLKIGKNPNSAKSQNRIALARFPVPTAVRTVDRSVAGVRRLLLPLNLSDRKSRRAESPTSRNSALSLSSRCHSAENSPPVGRRCRLSSLDGLPSRLEDSLVSSKGVASGTQHRGPVAAVVCRLLVPHRVAVVRTALLVPGSREFAPKALRNTPKLP